MKINLHNYEAYFLDYIEGRLDADTQKELENFLWDHPDIENTLNEFKNISLNPEEILYEQKVNLYKLEFEKSPVTNSNFGDYCIAYHENILTKDKKKECLTLSNQNLQNKEEFIRSAKVYLKPEANIIFPNKQNLYHKTRSIESRKVRIISTWTAVAAAVILLLIIFMPDHNKLNTSEQPAIVTNRTIKNETNPNPINSTVNKNALSYGQKKNDQKSRIDTIKSRIQIGLKTSQINDSVLKPLIAKEYKIQSPEIKNKSLDINKIVVQNIDVQGKENSTDSTTIIEENVGNRKSLLAYAETGINKINQITGSNIELSHQTNKSGKITTLSIKTGIFGFYRKRSRE